MLKEFSIANFKAFCEEQRIPLKPITLIFGANSSGKSSILQSLILAHQAVKGEDLDAKRPKIGGESVDLGGFHQYVHRRDLKRVVVFGYDFSRPDDFRFKSDLLENSKDFRITFEIGFDSSKRGPRVVGYTAHVDQQELFRMVVSPEGDMRVAHWESEHPVSERLFAMWKESGRVKRSEYWEVVRDYVSHLKIDSEGFIPARIFEGNWNDLTGNQFQLRTLLQNLISALHPENDENAVVSTSDPALQELNRERALRLPLETVFEGAFNNILSDLLDLYRNSLGRFEYLGPLRTIPRRHLDDVEDTAEHRASGAYAWNEVKHRPDVRKKVNDCLDRLGTGYRIEVRHLIGGDPLPKFVRKHLEAALRNSIEQFIGKQSRAEEPVTATEIRRFVEENPPLHDQLANSWWQAHREYLKEFVSEEDAEAYTLELAKDEVLDTVDTLYREEVSEYRRDRFDPKDRFVRDAADVKINGDLEGRIEVVFVDRNTGTIMTHRDIGVGISQILPVLVHAYGSEGRMIAIEQPEIHIHPKLQAELGDVFIDSALGKNQNTFLLETHSEHLILRILRRIRQTSVGELDEGQVPVRPDDVCVLYVTKGDSGAKIKQLAIDGEGDFCEDWPDGFFDERAKEIFG